VGAQARARPASLWMEKNSVLISRFRDLKYEELKCGGGFHKKTFTLTTRHLIRAGGSTTNKANPNGKAAIFKHVPMVPNIPESVSRWCPPSLGSTKVNTDGAWDSWSKEAGCGWLYVRACLTDPLKGLTP
jgi:hypothetical protein